MPNSSSANMNPDGPILDPGDQKVIGQSFSTPSSRTANRVYFFLMLGLTLLGVGCLFFGEYIAGGVMTLVGIVAACLFARSELSERSMLRRMRSRGEHGSHDRHVT